MKQINWFWKLAVDLLIVGGFILLSLPFTKENFIGIQLSQRQLIISDQLPAEVSEEKIQIPTIEDVLDLQSTRVTAYGFVSIEEIQFQQPLLVGLTNQKLLEGGVVMYPDRLPNQDNFVLLGHHLGKKNLLFGLLEQAKVGMKVSVTYLDQIQDYTIDKIKTVNETDLEVIENRQQLLTLITCPTPTRTTERLVITAKPVLMSSKKTDTTATNDKFKNQRLESSQRQTQIWRHQGISSWFFLGICFFMMWGCIWLAHRFMVYKDKTNG